MREDRTFNLTASLLARSSGSTGAGVRCEDWPYVVEMATEDGLSGLLLEALDEDEVQAPAFAHRALQAGARSVAQCNERMMGQLEPLIAALNAADIPVMLLKGAALGVSVYQSRSLRPMSDVDLLVREQDAVHAVAMLMQAGCTEGLSLIRSDFFPRFYYETELVTTDPKPLRIDLHARPLRPLRCARLVDEATFWHGARPVRVGASVALIPSPETMLIHLAAHAAFHGCARLIWLYDLKRWVDTCGSSINWARSEQLCAEWRLSLPVRVALSHAESVFGSFLPDETRRQLASHRMSWRDRMTLAQAPRDAGSPWLHVVTDLLCTPGWRFRMGYVFALLTPDRAHLADVYPFRHRGWVCAATAYRIVRAVGRLLTGVVRRVPLVGGFVRSGVSLHGTIGQRNTSTPSAETGEAINAASAVSARACPGM